VGEPTPGKTRFARVEVLDFSAHVARARALGFFSSESSKPVESRRAIGIVA
jgi:hypothetical protein